MPIPVTDLIAPTAPTDTYATHDSQYGLGGYKEVALITDRDAISTERRRTGMLVWVEETQTTYRLKDDNTWTTGEFVSRSGDTMAGALNFHNDDVPLTSNLTVDFDKGNFQTMPAPTGDVTIIFTNLPSAGDVKVVSLRFLPATASYNIAMPFDVIYLTPVGVCPAGKVVTLSFTAWGPNHPDLLVAVVVQI